MIKAPTKGFSLPAALLLTAAMGYWGHFFIVAFASADQKPAAYILWLFVTGVFFLISHTGGFSRYRRLFFVVLALLFFPEFIGRLLETRGSMAISQEIVFSNDVPFCHIVIPSVTLPFILTGSVVFPAGVRGIYQMLFIWLAATLMIGRGWCSWACFFGGWDDGISRLAKSARLKIHPGNNRLRLIPFVILAFAVLASLGALAPVFCDWLCPFTAITEFAPIDSLRSYVMTIFFILLFFGLVVVLPYLTRKRFQCLSFCPMGALQSLLNKVSLYRVRIDPLRCTRCLACVNACPMLALSPDIVREGKGSPSITCTRCGECISICPGRAIDYAFAFGWPGNRGECGNRKMARRGGKWGAIARKVLHVGGEVLSARALFTFSAYFFGMVFLSSFGKGTIARLLRLVMA